MNSRVFASIGVLAGLALTTCRSDPLSDLNSTPSALSISAAALTLDDGTTSSLTASVLDGRATPLEEAVTFTSRNTAVVSLDVDPAVPPPVPATKSQIRVRAVGPGATYIDVTSGSLKDSVRVIVLPVSFSGALSSTTPKGGSTLVIASTALLKFNPATATVTFPSYGAATLVSRTADTVKVLVPFGAAPGRLTIAGIAVTYVAGLTVSLPTVASVTVSGDFWAADDSWQTAPSITALLPVKGATARMVVTTTGTANAAKCPEVALAFGSSGPCMFFRFTLADTATYIFSTDWQGAALAPDIDIYVCSDSTVANFGTACFEDGGAGATASKPQATSLHKYPAGDHWFVIEAYDNNPASANITTTISRP